jgi:hypothetical protein
LEKKIPTGIFGIKNGIGIPLPIGVPEIGTKNQNSQPSFIEAQGYSVEQNLLFQDNQSTMHLKVNGSFFSSKCTKHIKC